VIVFSLYYFLYRLVLSVCVPFHCALFWFRWVWLFVVYCVSVCVISVSLRICTCCCCVLVIVNVFVHAHGYDMIVCYVHACVYASHDVCCNVFKEVCVPWYCYGCGRMWLCMCKLYVVFFVCQRMLIIIVCVFVVGMRLIDVAYAYDV